MGESWKYKANRDCGKHRFSKEHVWSSNWDCHPINNISYEYCLKMLTANGTKMIKINSQNYLQLLCHCRPHWVRAKDLPALPSLRTLPPSGGANSSKISSKKKIQDHPCLYFVITFFPSLPLGSRLRHSIAAYQYWNFQFQQPESAYIQVND